MEKIKDKNAKLHPDSLGAEPKKSVQIDTTHLNKYGDLLNDDPKYNKKYPFWIPATEVLAANAFVWSVDRYAMNADYARISPTTWKYNIQKAGNGTLTGLE